MKLSLIKRVIILLTGLTTIYLGGVGCGAAVDVGGIDIDQDIDYIELKGEVVVEELMDELCDSALKCDDTLNHDLCLQYLESDEKVWTKFGLNDSETNRDAQQVKEDIDDQVIQVNQDRFWDCRQELDQVCDENPNSIDIGTYDEVKTIVPEDNHCSFVLIE